MRVLGIDPAAAGPAGYGVVETDGATFRTLRFGALSRAPRASFPERLRAIHALIVDLVEEFSPDAVALESVFTALNMKTALKLAEVRGVVTLAAAQAGVPVHSYAPREVKVSVAGYGHADKEQIQQMVRATLNLRETPQPSDAADALAIALCHIYSTQARSRIAAATAPALPKLRDAPAHRIQPSR
ncbi:MAG: crossover junction endodeoxyribonuclease RuvC [Acidobacteria bacterium]|nr:crossover junction endodeoxyribonuclease RuvC [Acidobacteriota bacterium]MBI3662633.1 crossover junction endodeoxyribonuclease RuvC [Acidobacteriota bacterium]